MGIYKFLSSVYDLKYILCC